MEEKKAFYYLIRKKTIAKQEINGEGSYYYLLKEGKWVEDTDRVVWEHLWGYDPSEPEDSPYRFGSTSILTEMEDLTKEQAIQLINRQTLDVLKKKWKSDFAAKKEAWDKNRGWPAKYVETNFSLNGIRYSLHPTDIGLTNDGWDEGFMESIQADISKDLEEYGATDICNHGFLD